MGRKILGCFGGLLGLLIVLGIAMMPLEEQPDEPHASGVTASNTSVPVFSSEPQTVVSPSTSASSLTTEPITSPEPVVPPSPEPAVEPTVDVTLEQADYVLNTNSKKFHYPDCPSVGLMNNENKRFFVGTRDEVMAQGFDPCQNCNP